MNLLGSVLRAGGGRNFFELISYKALVGSAKGHLRECIVREFGLEEGFVEVRVCVGDGVNDSNVVFQADGSCVVGVLVYELKSGELGPEYVLF